MQIYEVFIEAIKKGRFGEESVLDLQAIFDFYLHYQNYQKFKAVVIALDCLSIISI
jgi:protein subunit release factor A